MNINPMFLIDFYKVGHVEQYPRGIHQVWSNWTPRYGRTSDSTGARHFGLQYFLMEYLCRQFDFQFFRIPKKQVIAEYKELITATLGVTNPKTDHIEALHDLKHIPLAIWSVPEGTMVPYGVPAVVLTNTAPGFFWLPNYIETLMSNILWMPCNSATMAGDYRRIFRGYAEEAKEKDLSFIDWQGHDFSFRGLPGIEAAMLSGMGHLTAFRGTDTIPAILAAKEYYGAALSVGGSVPATEHSVMSAGGFAGEYQTFERLLTEIYPTGIVSIVSDTWNLWKVLTEYLPRMKTMLLARPGKLVIRPDSGDPVKILVGDPDSPEGPVRAGAIRLIRDAMGVDAQGMLNKVGTIYGDAITRDRARRILSTTIKEIQVSPYNHVFGIGSFTYQYTTRDEHGYAMKATNTTLANGDQLAIYKDPVTDSAGSSKKSHRGIPVAYYDDNGLLQCKDEQHPDALDSDWSAFHRVFFRGHLENTCTFSQVRKHCGGPRD